MKNREVGSGGWEMGSEDYRVEEGMYKGTEKQDG